MNYSIIVKNIHKSYQGGKKERDAVFRDVIINFLLIPYRYIFKHARIKQLYYNALNGVSFKVRRGEVLGLIGKNGAGKSTLLKILSRITEPTKGEAMFYGKIGSLIEVGTGFHQELTGRENIYLNGAILGMNRKEVDQKFDQIVEFSGVDKYLDIPVKKYSSGMYVRLAFAVAAHLDTDILLIDEVLSVGDAEFQQKCLGKVKDIASSGRTVIFVSHNMSVISQLCSRCLVLNGGKIVFDGKPNKAISKYLASQYEYFGIRKFGPDLNKTINLRKIITANIDDKPSSVLDISKKIQITIEYCVNKEVSNAVVFASICSLEGVVFLKSTDASSISRKRNIGKYHATLELPSYLINVGRYVLSVGAEIPDKNGVDREVLDEANVFQFECVDSSGLLDDYGDGVIAPKYSWQSEKMKND
jgi:lipopolysaccharide transport system ATP-binding protein